MKNIRRETQIWLQIISFVVIWAVVLYLTDTGFSINVEALKKLPEVVTLYTLLYLGFAKWGWRWRVFQGWLVPFPDLEGTWEGTVQTTWQDASGSMMPATTVFLVIKQSYSSVSCVMHSKESISHSNAAMISEDENSGLKKLSYNYTNTPRVMVRDRSVVHDGAAILRIINDGARALEGEYWTNRKSTGEINVRFKTRSLMQAFPD